MKSQIHIGRLAGPLLLALALACGVGVLLTGCGRESTEGAGTAEAPKTLYTCGMHPQVIQDHPGNCPICGMKLTPIRKQAGVAGSKPAAASQTIEVDPVTTQTMGIRTAIVHPGPLRHTVRTVGTIDYNETAMADVTTKVKGWIEKLYVDATGQLVMQEDPLFEIYSPELYSAQREYLLALEQQKGNGSTNSLLKTSARNKLRFFDISEGQIAELERTGQPMKTLRIQAPMDGFVVEKTVVQGQMVDPGTKTYRLADLGLVWVQAQIYEQDLPYVTLGQEATVTLSSFPDREFRGRVTYIYPNVDEKTRTARVRMEFHNPGYLLKPGMFATVQVTSELAPSVLLVPDMAILRSGEKNTVFVALPGGKFEPRVITLGPQAEQDMYQVISGLKEGERVVTSGQFMLDSESQLREAIQKMVEPKGAATSAPATAGALAGASGSTAAPESTTIKYLCPMPEHISIQYDHPGACPLCGMALVPVSEAALKQLPPGGRLLYYTCPMPEHSDVRSDKPGKCPKCGMTLIPVMVLPPLSTNGSPQAGSGQPAAVPPILYTCPMAMHAHVVSDKPGQCPECEMELVPASTVKHGRIAEESWRKQHSGAPH
jgi:RND family efflux transporter MFP subunit